MVQFSQPPNTQNQSKEKNMETYALTFVAISILSLLLFGVGKALYIVWFKPTRLERKVKEQGIGGTDYKLLFGDMKELVRLMTEAWSNPLSLTHKIVPRVDPFTLAYLQKHGTYNNTNIVCYYSCDLTLYDRIVSLI